jgi:hypothetical protein
VTRGPCVAAALTAIALLLSTACGGNDSGPAPTEPPTPAPTSTVLVPADPTVTVANAVQACREKDAQRLRSLLAAPVSDDEIEAMWRDGTDVRLLNQTIPEITDGPVEVTVVLRIDARDEQFDAERTWELERGPDAVWRLTKLPDCY